MARIIDDQINPWGRQAGIDAQRADLWVTDFTQALSGLSTAALDGLPMTPGLTSVFVPPKIATYYCQEVNLPDLRVRGEPVVRDSRPYMMPGYDEPCEAVRMVFLLDCFKPGKDFDPYQSDLYQMLDVWRAVVRAGRGPMSSEYSIRLNDNYRIDYAFDIGVNLLSPSIPAVTGGGGVAAITASTSVANDLQYSLKLKLVNCWLSSFRIGELSYEGARLLRIDAVFYTEDVQQPPRLGQ